jgi:sugar phosphate permease
VAVSLIYFPLYFIDVKHMSYVSTLSYEFIAYALAGIGYVYTGFVGNKIGRKWIMGINLVVAGFLMIGVVLMTIPAWLLLFYSLFIAIHYSQWAAWPFYVAETYPTRMRGTASNFAYAFQWAGNIILPTAMLGVLYLTGFNWNLVLEILIVIPLFILPGIVYGFKKSSATAELEKNAI